MARNTRPSNSGGYRPGFEPRPGESDAERLKRETEFLKAKAAAEGAKSRQQRAEDEKIGFTYQKPVAPKPGYRRGFEPRPGESEAERLKREMEELKRRARGRASGANYDHYKNASGGEIKKMASGGSASKRADGIARKGKTKGKMV